MDLKIKDYTKWFTFLTNHPHSLSQLCRLTPPLLHLHVDDQILLDLLPELNQAEAPKNSINIGSTQKYLHFVPNSLAINRSVHFADVAGDLLLRRASSMKVNNDRLKYLADRVHHELDLAQSPQHPKTQM
jgi:hypothetical protein